jgi:hypothetical protein
VIAKPVRFALLALCGMSVQKESAEAQVGGTAKLVVDQRIVAANEDLTEVRAAWLLPDNSIVLSQHKDSRVVVFDSSGARKYSLARAGAGPGEFGRWSAAGGSSFLGGVHGDTLWFYDEMLRRFTWFRGSRVLRTTPLSSQYSTASTELARRPLTTASTLLGIRPGAIARDGAILGVAEFGTIFRTGDDGHGRNIRRDIARTVPGSANVLSLMPLPPDSTMVHAAVSRDSLAGRYMPVPFRSEPQLAFAQDGSVFAMTTNLVENDGPQVELKLIGADGVLRYRRRWTITPVRVTTRMIDSAITAQREYSKQSVAGDARAQAAVTRMRSKKPGIEEELESEARRRAPRFVERRITVCLTNDGFTWVNLPANGSTRQIEMLDSAGRTLLSGQIPANTRVISGSGSLVWTLGHDADDLPVLTRYRLR